MRRHQAAMVCTIAITALGLAAMPGLASVGSVTYVGCVGNAGAYGCPATTHQSLLGAQGIAVSPDGRSVYVASPTSQSITWFSRSASGKLTDSGCIASNGLNGCAVAFNPSLNQADAVAVSPDGRSVYVASGEGVNSITRFDRSSKGRLTYEDCFADGGVNGCTATAHADLENASASLTVSPDGKNLYVIGRDDDSVAIFARASSGALVDKGCIATGSSNGCETDTLGSLLAPEAVGVSPDGRNVYVTASGTGTESATDGAITTFKRSASGGLTETGCLSDGTPSDCTKATYPTLFGGNAAAISPDGKNVYVSAYAGDALTVLNRSASGALTYRSCIADTTTAGCVTPTHYTLYGPVGAVVSPDGKNVYVTSQDAIGVLTRSAAGDLTYAKCIASNGEGGCNAAAHESLDGAERIAVSPDSGSIYVTGSNNGTSDAVTQLRRTLSAPATRITKTKMTKNSVTLSFTASELGSTFRCKLDHGAFRACTSPHRFGRLKKGTHHLFVEAVNSQGTPDASPAKQTEKLKR